MVDRIQREVKERGLRQGIEEEIIYSVTTTPWGSSPTDITVKAYDVDDDLTDVSSTVLSGSASANGDVISLPTLKSLTAGKLYRVEVKFTSGSQIFECFFEVEAER